MGQKRKKIWIDRFQTRLSLRIALYFVLYQVAVWAVAVISGHIAVRLLSESGEGAGVYCLALLVIAAGMLALMFIYDAVLFTHRIVGPLYRFRQILKAVAAGEEVALVTLRKNDFLVEMKDDFNEMLKGLEERGAITLKPEAAPQQENQPVAV
jgi:methyl-accepting chemotaxis protein